MKRLGGLSMFAARRMPPLVTYWRCLWAMSVFWPLLWLTVRHPRTQKNLWSTPSGYEIRLAGAQ